MNMNTMIMSQAKIVNAITASFSTFRNLFRTIPLRRPFRRRRRLAFPHEGALILTSFVEKK
ncbi:MAG: hypothetical protein PUJ57_02910, partial [Peptoniphilaceae bacterium]|nr:hypothetical protein [Peptoniphilaceae bacterium]MDY6085392.1 hypothetical protein [Peptoniphilaceae bacterium]